MGNLQLSLLMKMLFWWFLNIGFLTKEITVGEQESITVTLEEVSAKLEEVVVVGYGKKTKEMVTGSISTVNAQSFKDLPITSIDQGLVGQVAGVSVVQETGEPGRGLSFKIRSLTAISAGSEPLIVVDGIPFAEEADISVINPGEIASINILKDAASAAIYGSRGSNGVVIITTKTRDYR